MFCENCGMQLRDNAKFCYKCGHKAYLDSENASIESNFNARTAKSSTLQTLIPESQPESVYTSVAPKGSGKKSVLLMIFLSVITGGIYIPIWCFRQRSLLNKLSPAKKLSIGEIRAFLVIACVSVLMQLLNSPEKKTFDDMTNWELFLRIGTPLIFWLEMACVWDMAFKVRSILEEYYNGQLKMGVCFSKISTLFFHIFYLQHKLNLLPLPEEYQNTNKQE